MPARYLLQFKYATYYRLKCANLAIKTAFITCCLVLMNKPFTRHMIKHWNSFFKRRFSCGFVAAGDSCKYVLYLGSHHGTLTGVALTRLLGLASTFACLSRIGHGPPLINSKKLQLADYYAWLSIRSQSPSALGKLLFSHPIVALRARSLG